MMRLHRIFVLWLIASSSSLAWGQITSSTTQIVPRSTAEESLFHVQGLMIVHRRYVPSADVQDARKNLLSFGTAFHWQPQPWISFGPLFRGLSSFDSGTDTTRVTNRVNAIGVSFDVFPLSSSLYASDELHARVVLGSGILYNMESITFSHELIAEGRLTRTVTSWVFPLEAGGELILGNITLRVSMGYTFFAQSQSIYTGLGFGMFI